MPEYIASPQEPHRGPSRRNLLPLAAGLFGIFVVLKIALPYWLDLLWFTSLSYQDVFWKTITLQAGIFLVVAITTFAVLYGIFRVIRRCHEGDLPTAHAIVIGGRPVNLSVAPVLRIISLVVAAVIALVSGLALMAEWPTLALLWYAPHVAGGAVDPIFGRSINFFLFTLPAWTVINSWLMTLAVTSCAVAILFLIITSGTRTIQTRRFSSATSPWRGLSVSGAFLLLMLAIEVYLSRFQSLLDHHTIFDGANYTDVHVTITGLLIVSAALLLGAVIAAYNATREAEGRLLIAAVIPGVLSYALVGIVGWYVSAFIVKPNELVRELPYIAHNIAMTRQAFGLDGFSQSEFPAETTVDAAEPANNQPTLQNIRLWDWHALQDTLRQVQEIRTYYDFPDIDIDRYDINGTMREVMLATRELNVDKLPVSSRNWINEKLIYTHGYGVTMNPVNGFTSEGLPTLLLSNMPVQSTVPGLKVTRPEIYFGEMTDTDVYVKTRQKEFDYPQGQSNNLTSYEGEGGIPMGGFGRRVLLSIALGDLGTLPFSDDVNPASRLLLRRNVRTRVERLAPFLTFERDPYIVVGADGRLSWMMDAFTSSDAYPYSSHYVMAGTPVNYVRNSVKVVIDAYTGTTTFYAFDTTDPILAAYRRIFPRLFKDAAAMPADLRAHVRYPEALFKVQSEVYGLYHMTNPEVFFNREDIWTVATETTTDGNGAQSVQVMQPNFVLMKLPGGTAEEFVEILPFTPSNRNNLIGWIAGRCDGEHYGTAAVFDFPKTKLIDGPQQIEARIDQNAQLSGQLTLWNQQGSHVVRGSLIVIPSGRALLYAEPIYLQAQQSPMPELRLVVLALQDKLAYGTTFQAALGALFGGETSSLQAGPNGQATAAPAGPQAISPAPLASPASSDVNGLIAEAGKTFNDYQRLTAEGKLGEAGQKLDELKRVIERLNSTAPKK